jgi:RluA family pseudouridine synthase
MMNDYEQELLQQLEELKQELIRLRTLPEYQQFSDLTEEFRSQWQVLQQEHQQRKKLRDELRLLGSTQDLERQSQQDGLDRRQFKRDRDKVLKPIESIVNSANQRIQAIHQERQILYRQLQTYLQELSLESWVKPLPIIYEDDALIVVDKPTGMLSVPGRSGDRQSSVLRYLQQVHPTVRPIHRLDQDTSGILIFAKEANVHQMLQQQFADRQVHKIYEALLENPIEQISGTIELPLWGDPTERPYQRVNTDRGKPAITEFKKLADSRIELTPHTGRTHQLRVHMAIGLNNPILGDRLYGSDQPSDRLYLHAKYCRIGYQSQWLELKSAVPF